jgi:hypothetical protein
VTSVYVLSMPQARQAIAERLAKHKAALGPPSTNASAPVVKMESDPVATPVLSSEYARYQRERQKILHVRSAYMILIKESDKSSDT